MPPVPHAATVTIDPTCAALVDGVSCTTCGDDLIVYGGPIGDRIWRLHLPSATWTEIPCVGTIPIPRYFHAAAFCKGFLVMCGGELIASSSYCHAERINYYELNLETYEWMCVDGFGDVPQNRSHHTMTAVHEGNDIIFFGGKPVLPGVALGASPSSPSAAASAADRAMTTALLQEYCHAGFYDIYVYHVLARTWKRVQTFDPLCPALWGHSAVLYQNSHVLFFGGFDVSASDLRPIGSSGTSAVFTSDDAPRAILSNAVFILAVETLQWQRHDSGERQDLCPVPRALHGSQCCCDELVIFGGFTVNRSGHMVLANDAWFWDIRYGRWRRVEFCMPQWSSRKLISCQYGTQWLVAPSLDTVFFLEMSRPQSGWQRAQCSVQKLLAHPSERGKDLRRKELKHEAAETSPVHVFLPSPARQSSEYYATPFEWRGNVATADAHDPTAELLALQQEVSQLREQLHYLHSVSQTRHEVVLSLNNCAADNASEGNTVHQQRRLFRWCDMNSAEDPSVATRYPSSSPRGERSASAIGGNGSAGVAAPQEQRLSGWHRTRAPSPGGGSGAGGSHPAKAYQHDKTSIPVEPNSPASVDREVHSGDAKRRLGAARQNREGKQKFATTSSSLPEPPIPRIEEFSDASEENEEMYRAAELGLQVHRAALQSSASRRQVLLRERKQRILQLQERLKLLEAHEGGDGLAAGRPEHSALEVALRQSEALRRMVEAQASGRPWKPEDSPVTASSLDVGVPNTIAPPEIARSVSLGSVTPSEASSAAGAPTAYESRSAPKDLSSATEMVATTADYIAAPPPPPQDHTASLMPEAAPQQGTHHHRDRNSLAEPTAKSETAISFAPVFKGFQRRSSSNNVKSQTAADGDNGGRPSSPTRNSTAPEKKRSLRLALGTQKVDDASLALPSSRTPPALLQSPPRSPRGGANSLAAVQPPPTVSLQSQWDTLQAALLSRGTRHVFRAAN